MRLLMIAAALVFATAAATVHAQTSGTSPAPASKTQCQGPDGKDATNAKCKGAGPAPAAEAVYKLDAKGVCRDAKGKAVKKANCKPPSEQ
jgi:hypothetical protein